MADFLAFMIPHIENLIVARLSILNLLNLQQKLPELPFIDLNAFVNVEVDKILWRLR